MSKFSQAINFLCVDFLKLKNQEESLKLLRKMENA